LSIFIAIFRHINQPCPKWANALRKLLGNQIDRGIAIDFHVSHTASPVATGGFGELSPPKQCNKPPKMEK